MRYVEMPSSPALAGLVATYWGFTIHTLPHPAFIHRVWPDGCATLAICSVEGQAPVAVIVGASSMATEVPVHAGEQYWGIRFRPEAGGPCCGRTAVELRDRRVDAVEVFGDALSPLVERLSDFRDADDAPRVAEVFDAWLLANISPSLPVDALVRDAVDRIIANDGTGTIAAVADGLGVTTRHLQRRFRTATGMTPKQYASIRRARAALKRIAMPEPGAAARGLSDLAAASGYADQAHLTREVSRLTTFTPMVLAERLDEIAHDRLVD